MEGSRLTLFEVEGYIRGLQAFGLSDVGSDRWMAQHDHLEKLNIQAHADAISKHDEYVVDQFVSQEGKIELLVHELLVIEAWKEKVFPLLLSHFTPISNVKAYIVLYHEATICNLLEILLYHQSVCEVGGDSMLELGDYCCRKINALNAGVFKKLQEEDSSSSSSKEELKKSMLEKSTADSLKQQHLEIGFSVAVCATGLLRFLSDHVNVLPLGVTSRLLHTHDVLLSLVPLVESPPWTRRRAGKTEKFSDQRWMEIKHADLPMMTKLEGQVWLTIYNLIMDKNCRKQYQYNTLRKEVLVRLKRFFTEVLLDQLPLLRELKRFIEELAIMEPPPPTASSIAIIEQVPEMRDAIISNANWEKIADECKKTHFSNDEKARQRELARLAATYNMDNFDEVLSKPHCGECGKQGENMKRCSRCKNEWYCGRTCQVANWKKHQKLCDLMAKDAKPAAAPTSTSSATASSASTPSTASAAAKPAAQPAAKPATTASTASTASTSSSAYTPPKHASSASASAGASSGSASGSSTSQADAIRAAMMSDPEVLQLIAKPGMAEKIQAVMSNPALALGDPDVMKIVMKLKGAGSTNAPKQPAPAAAAAKPTILTKAPPEAEVKPVEVKIPVVATAPAATPPTVEADAGASKTFAKGKIVMLDEMD